MTALVISVVAWIGIPLVVLGLLALRAFFEDRKMTRQGVRKLDDSLDRLLSGGRERSLRDRRRRS